MRRFETLESGRQRWVEEVGDARDSPAVEGEREQAGRRTAQGADEGRLAVHSSAGHRKVTPGSVGGAGV